jgi:hypothetical protein
MPESKAWEPVWQGNGEAQAQIVADGLGQYGIRARVQGARPIQGLPSAFQLNTWAVIVPLAQAETARARLREQGEGSSVVTGSGPTMSDRAATLRFALLLALACLGVGLFVALRQALA